jgi:Abhydrolase family
MDDFAGYFQHLYDPNRRQFACSATNPDEFALWRRSASSALRNLLRLDTIARQNDGHRPSVMIVNQEDCGTYLRERAFITTEPGLSIPFWILRPKTAGPYPLAITPHGHTQHGADQYVGIARDERGSKLIEEEERDVAVQAVQRGYFTITPTTRGFAPIIIPDPNQRHGGSCCRSQLIHALLAGRTALGERVWDLMRLLDWAQECELVDGSRVLVLGNSGGCVLTALLAACDSRISVAIMNCCFCTFVGTDGSIHLCDCNTVPGMMEFGDFPDIAGLIAPRPLLVVNGVADSHPLDEVERAVTDLKRIYRISGEPHRLVHIYAPGGCRFYKALMWPFVEGAFAGHKPRTSN